MEEKKEIVVGSVVRTPYNDVGIVTLIRHGRNSWVGKMVAEIRIKSSPVASRGRHIFITKSYLIDSLTVCGKITYSE